VVVDARNIDQILELAAGELVEVVVSNSGVVAENISGTRALA
jgi:hypothetical protein